MVANLITVYSSRFRRRIYERYKKPTAIVFIVITALLWSFGGLLIKLVDSNAIAIAGGRSAIAAIMLLLYVRKPRFTWSFPQIGAALSYTATVILFVVANKLTTAANAILLQYTAPIYVALLGAWFLKEKTRLYDWIAIILTFGGMALFFLDQLGAGELLGNICSLLSGVTFAFFAVFMRMQKDASPIESVILGNALTALIGLPFLFSDLPGPKGWLSLILLGVFQLGLSYIFYTKAVNRLTALELILIPVLEPILSPVWALLIGEIPGRFAIAGGIVVLTVIVAWCLLPVIKRGNGNSEAAGQTRGKGP